jgi:N utilization substance protein B
MATIHRQGRTLAFQALFEAEFARVTAMAALDRGLVGRASPARDAEYARALVAGVTAEQASLDETIAREAPAHPVSQIALVDRVVLRIALYELLFNNAAVPTGAVINEAVELAKTFGSDASRRFVNGVLGSVSRKRVASAAGPTETEEPGGAI